jgi:predicted dehydrogenase
MRTSIIGTGMIAAVHARAVRSAGGTVVAVAGSSREKAERAAAAFGADRAAPADDAAAADDVDVVHICTPNHLHTELALAALAAGKHVVCEKPLATTVESAEQMARAAQDAGTVAAVPFVYRFYPTVRQARAELLGAGGVPADRLWLLHGSYLQDWMATDSGNWRSDPRLGGASRAFGDIGVHWCDLMEFTTGHRITRVSATLGSSAGGSRSTNEDGGVVAFQTAAGALGSVVVSQVSPGRKNRLWFSFDGRERAYVFDQELPDSLWVGGLGANSVVPRDAAGMHPSARRYSRLPAGHPQGYQECFDGFVADVHEAVRSAAPEGLPTFEDGLRAAYLTEAVLESAASGRWVDVPTSRLMPHPAVGVSG